MLVVLIPLGRGISPPQSSDFTATVIGNYTCNDGTMCEDENVKFSEWYKTVFVDSSNQRYREDVRTNCTGFAGNSCPSTTFSRFILKDKNDKQMLLNIGADGVCTRLDPLYWVDASLGYWQPVQKTNCVTTFNCTCSSTEIGALSDVISVSKYDGESTQSGVRVSNWSYDTRCGYGNYFSDFMYSWKMDTATHLPVSMHYTYSATAMGPWSADSWFFSVKSEAFPPQDSVFQPPQSCSHYFETL